MITKENLEKIKKAVHQPLNWEDYSSTFVRENTNCFSHAIGSTCTVDNSAYRLGMLSANKGIEEPYLSEEEVKSLFLADMSVFELGVEEIPFQNLTLFLRDMQNLELEDNEHIVALFVKVYGKEKNVREFHFWRYDRDKGWSDKRWGWKVHFVENISREWPSEWMDELVGVFKITR